MHAQKRLSVPRAVSGYPTTVSTRFMLRCTRGHVLVTWTRYSIADHMHIVKYDKRKGVGDTSPTSRLRTGHGHKLT